MPALSKSKEQAKAIACISHLDQIGKAVVMYVNDYDGWMPIGATATNYPGQWKVDISPYISGKTLSTLSNAIGEGVYACPSSQVNLDCPVYQQGGYGWNFFFMGYSMGDATRKRVRFNSVPLPSETIVAGDTIDWGDYFYQRMYFYYSSASITPCGIGNRHNRGVNLLWADCHISWMSQNEIRAGKNGSQNYYCTKDK